jgi:hypothetical protein
MWDRRWRVVKGEALKKGEGRTRKKGRAESAKKTLMREGEERGETRGDELVSEAKFEKGMVERFRRKAESN